MIQLMILVAIATQIRGDIKILDTPSHETGPEPCTRICSGVSWWDDVGLYEWRSSTVYPSKMFRFNDMQECGFVRQPVVVATAGGKSNNLCPSVAISHIDKARFDLYTVEDSSLSYITQRECNIYWTASGYTC